MRHDYVPGHGLQHIQMTYISFSCRLFSGGTDDTSCPTTT